MTEQEDDDRAGGLRQSRWTMTEQGDDNRWTMTEQGDDNRWTMTEQGDDGRTRHDKRRGTITEQTDYDREGRR